MVSFSWINSCLCIYNFIVWSDFNLSHNSQWNSFFTKSCQVRYSANLLHSLLMWLIVLSLSLCNVHSLVCWVLSIMTLMSSSSSSSHRAISTDIPDPLSSPFSIVHCFQQVFRNASRIGTELLYIGSSWSSCSRSSMWRGRQEYITFEFVPTSPAVSCI